MIVSRLAHSLWVLVASICWLSQNAEAAAGYSDEVFCSNVSTVGTVCATGEFYTPSPMSIDNVTTYGGGYSDYFYIANTANETSGLKISTMLSDQGVCDVKVKYPGEENWESCQTCTKCGGDATTLYSANCTNVWHGRVVECESSSVASSDIYFPLTAEGLAYFTTYGNTISTSDDSGSGDDMPMNTTDGHTNTTSDDSGDDMPTNSTDGSTNTTDGTDSTPAPAPVGPELGILGIFLSVIMDIFDFLFGFLSSLFN